MGDLLAESWWQLVLTIVGLGVSLAATYHVLLYKRETRSAIGWIGLIWLSPLVGSGTYLLLGVNRIRRQARRLRRRANKKGKKAPSMPLHRLEREASPSARHLLPVARLVGEVTRRPLWEGNAITPLDNGDEAYPAMVRAIDNARASITLLTYIFYPDKAGQPFIEAMARAVDRGVEVRVLIDDVGSRYGLTSSVGTLRREGVQVATFNPTLQPGWIRFANLRNHRKLMVVDGRIGFTGGMNILVDYMPSANPKGLKRDLHFQVEGPIVTDLQHTFMSDWAFTTGEVLDGDRWLPDLDLVEHGTTVARGIADGPDDDEDRIALTIMGALACARSSVVVMTPYFVPENPLLTALGVAALRGVEVDVIVPQDNNHKFVAWAMVPHLEVLLEMGCRVWLSAPPFDHTKLVVVDGLWVLFGSANWDARSLVLNFEYVLECYDENLAMRLKPMIQQRLESATRLTLEDVRGRPLPIKLRDGLARLLSPYL